MPSMVDFLYVMMPFAKGKEKRIEKQIITGIKDIEVSRGDAMICPLLRPRWECSPPDLAVSPPLL